MLRKFITLPETETFQNQSWTEILDCQPRDYNHFCDTLRHFDCSTNSSTKHGIPELSYELPNDVRLYLLEIRKYHKNLKTS